MLLLVRIQSGALDVMRDLKDHLNEVEKYAFRRDTFPRSYNGHHIVLIRNDANISDEDSRLVFDLSLHCVRCNEGSQISGRFPHSFDDPIRGIVGAKIAAIETYHSNECV